MIKDLKGITFAIWPTSKNCMLKCIKQISGELKHQKIEEIL